jgi:hypothetical protein
VWFFSGSDYVEQKVHQRGIAGLAQIRLAIAVCYHLLSAFSAAFDNHVYASLSCGISASVSEVSSVRPQSADPKQKDTTT